MATEQLEVAIDTSQRIRLKNRDLIDFQRVTGKRFVGAMKALEKAGDDPDWEVLTALLWILGRRDNPSFTFEQALDADIDQQQLLSLVNLIADPTGPASTEAS